jgi:hypothetical protein
MGYIVDDIKVSFGQANPTAKIQMNGYPSTMNDLASTLLASGLIASGPIVISGKNDVVISGVHVTNPNGSCIKVTNKSSNIVIKDSIIGPCNEEGIEILDSSHVTITRNYIHDAVKEGVRSYKAHHISVDSNMLEDVKSGYAMWTTNIGNLTFTNNFVKNVHRASKNGGNVVMVAYVRAKGIRINNNVAINQLGKSDTEDLVNTYKSNGTPGDPIQINNNQFYGSGSSHSGGGILLGDGGGSYMEARNNILVNPGQYGLAMSGHHQVFSNNKVYSDNLRPFTNIGVSIGWTASQTGGGDCYALEFSHNEITFYKGRDFIKSPDVKPYLSPYWKWSGCQIAGWETNKVDTPYKQPANLDETILPPEILKLK